MQPSRAAAATDDLSTLAWVLEELRKSLETAHKALRRYLRDAEASSGSDLDDVDPAVLRTARQQLHQSMGALELLNLTEGVAVLRASETLVQRFVARPQRLDAAGVAAIERASFALLDYLGRRLAGKPVQALGLFPVLRTLHELNGAERIHPADLWPQDWRWREVPALTVTPRAPDATMLASFERRLLALVRTNALDQAVALRSDCCAIAAHMAAHLDTPGQGSTEAITLWRIAGGFFEAWAMDRLPNDVFVKRTASRLLAQLRLQIKGDVSVSDRLAQDLLFYCARAVMPAGAASPCLNAVRAGYQLSVPSRAPTIVPEAGSEADWPIDYNAIVYGRFDPSSVAQARKRVEAAKQAYAAVAGGELHQLDALPEPFGLLQESLGRIYPADARLGVALLGLARRTVAQRRVPEPAVAMEVATSLLYLDAVLEDGDFDQPVELERLRHLAARLDSVAGGAPAQPLDPWMEAVYRRVSDRHTLGSVVHELRARLQEVERLLDRYFRDPDHPEGLGPVPGELSDMRGVFTVLGVEPAERAVGRMRDDVLALAHPDGADPYGPDAVAGMQRLAGNLGALGFLVDMLHVQPQLAKVLFIFDARAGVLAPLMGRHADVPDLVDRAQAIAEAVQREGASLAAVTQDLDALARQPLIDAQPDLAASLQAARAAIEEARSGAGSADREEAAREHLVEAMTDFVSAATSPAPFDALEPSFSRPAPLEALAPEDADLADDPELREVFLEEAREVLAQARQSMGLLAQAPSDLPSLTTMRRVFHTLKGSARMVGLGRVGEAAWSCEQLYNHWLAGGEPASPALQQVSADAVAYFQAWTEAIADGHPQGFEPEPVILSAEALRLAGERIRILRPGAAAPPASGSADAVSLPVDGGLPERTDANLVDTGLAGLDLEIPDLAQAPVLEPLAATRPMPLDTQALDLAPIPGDEVDLPLDFDPRPRASATVSPAEPAIAPAATPSPVDAPASARAPAPAPVSELARFLPPGLTLDLVAPEPLAEEEAVRHIGELRVPAELFNIYTAEADELSRRLVAELEEWALEAERPVADSTNALAHSLGGGSATVGYGDLCELARGLESALERSPARMPCGPEDHALFQEVAQEIRRLLQQFSAGFLREPDGELLARVQVWPASWAPARSAIPSADARDDAAWVAPPVIDPEISVVAEAAEDPAGRVAEDVLDDDIEEGAPLVTGSADALAPRIDVSPSVAPEAPPTLSDGLVAVTATEAAEPAAAPTLTRWGAAIASAAASLVGLGKRHDSIADAPVEPRLAPLEPLQPAQAQAPVESPVGAVSGVATADPVAAEAAAAAGDAGLEAPRARSEMPAPPVASLDEGGTVLEVPEPSPEPGVLVQEWSVEVRSDIEEPPAERLAPAPAAAPLAPTLTVALPVLDEVVEPDDAEFLGGLASAPEGVAEVPSRAPLEALPVSPSAAPVALLRPEPVRPEPVVLRDVVVLEALQTDIDERDQVDVDLFPIFEEEAEDLLPQLAQQVQAWQAHPQDQDAGSACMRLLHTFKGGARLAGAMRLGEMAHRCESAIQVLMNREHVDPDDLNALQGRIDTLTHTFERLRRQQAGEPMSGFAPMGLDAGEWSTRTGALSEFVADVTHDDGPPSAPAAPGEPPPPPIDWARLAESRASAAVGPAGEVGRAAERPLAITQPVRVRIQVLDRLVNLAGEVNITRARLDAEVGQIRGSLADLSDNLDRLNQQLGDIALQADTQLQSRREAARVAAQDFDPLELDRYTRLQELTRILAESVNDVATVRSTMQRTLQTTEDELAAQARLTRELQSDLLRTRMVEFDSLSERLYRVVRQAAKETGKLVRLDLVGGGIEVDRSVLDRMVPAFEHLLRNCVSHGIELPDVRQGLDKDPTGSVVVTVEQEGNEVTVEIRDDGAGLDLAAIRARAEAMGLVTPEAVLHERELAQLILAPGLSTAAAVTELAGRGVGMDVVRADVQAMGGRVEIRTETARGSRFKLVLPLTTVVTQVVMLRCGDTTIAVPSNLIELVQRATPASVETAYREGVYLYGGLRLPFFWLGALLDRSGMGPLTGRTQPIVILRSAQHRVALHVDDVQGTHEVVVKNLGPQLSGLPGLAGLTMLPSGQVALIYNPVTLAAIYGDRARLRAREAADSPAQSDTGAAADAPQTALVLVVDDSLTVRRITRRLLEREGYRVKLAKDGLEALELLGDERPAVVLSDIEMPRMDGFDLLRNIRSDAVLSDLPVVMITSRIAEKHRDHAKLLGADHYLGKPYSEEELLGLVRRYAPRSVTGKAT